MAIDISRGTEGLSALLPPAVSSEIWADVQRESIVQRLARRVTIPGSGLTIPIITADPEAQWVDETEEKPVSRSSFGSKSLKAYTMAVIEPFSRQVTRDLPGLYNACRQRLPKALARKFDRAALGFEDSPGTGFETLADVTEIDLTDDVYGGALAALGTVASSADGADVSGWALSPMGEVAFLAALDGNDRPLFTLSPAADGSVGQVLGRPVYKTSHVAEPSKNVIGVCGDWGSAIWGYVEAVRIDVSTEATLTDVDGKQLNLFQRNMVAVRAECEVSFGFRDGARFVRLTHSGAIPGMPVGVSPAKAAAKKAPAPSS
jgi:HK97 family phage major capsid protein